MSDSAVVFESAQIPDGPWRRWWESFRLHLDAAGRAAATVESYGYALKQLAEYLGPDAPPPPKVTRQQIQGFMARLNAERSPKTAQTRYRALSSFFNWLIDEGEIDRSPLARVPPPRVVEKPPDVLRLDDVARMLRACEGKLFKDRRDAALIRFLFDTGCRAGEVVGLRVEDVNVSAGTATVTGKGRRVRVVAFGRKAARDLDRYLRARAVHRHAPAPMLWIGERGPLAVDAVRTVLKTRARQAGLDQRVFTHLARHSFAHLWLAEGGNESDLMRLAGWSNSVMLQRYGASAATERAINAHRERSPGDRV